MKGEPYDPRLWHYALMRRGVFARVLTKWVDKTIKKMEEELDALD